MKKILVIDDEQTIRDTISVLLSTRGYEVVTAADGLAGVKVARQEKPDLVISDIAMEPVDGFMTLSIIKQLPGTGRIPFIMVTGDRELETMRKGLTLGADDYITKPFSPETILDTIATQLKRREAEIAAAVGQVTALRDLLTAPEGDELVADVEEIRQAGARIAETPDAGETIRKLGGDIARKARGLRSKLTNTRLLEEIEGIAANPDALNVLRGAAGCELRDVVESECRRIAEQYDRVDRLQFQGVSARVAFGSATLSRVAAELAENACKHSPPETEVTVKCRAADQSVQVSVENVIRRRAPKTATGETPGEPWPDYEPGLGLRLVRRLVQVHGGGFAIVPRSRETVAVQIELPLLSARGGERTGT